MSIDRNIYVGPLVVCKTAVGKVDVPVGLKCPTHGAVDFIPRLAGPPKFCPECGVPVVPAMESLLRAKVEIPEGIFDDLMDVEGDDWPAGEQVFVPNIGADYSPRPFHLDDTYSHRDFIDAAAIEEDRKWLANKYRVALDKLRAAYGSDNVRVAWGVLRWSS